MGRHFLFHIILFIPSLLAAQYYTDDLVNDSYQVDGQYQEAEDWYSQDSFTRALALFNEIAETLHPLRDESEALFANWLSASGRRLYCLRKLKQPAKADSLIQILEAEVIAKQRQDILPYSYVLHTKASIEKDPAISEPIWKEALAIRTKYLDSTHADVTWVYDNLGGEYLKLKRYQDAYNLMNRAKRLRMQSENPDSALIIASYINLFLPHFYQQKYIEAKTFLDTAYNLAQQALPPDHAYFTTLLGNLGVICGLLEMPEQAIEYGKAAIHYKKQRLDDWTDRSFLVSYFGLAGLYFDLHKPIQSKRYLDTIRMILDQYEEPMQEGEVYWRLRTSNVEKSNNKRLSLLTDAMKICEGNNYIQTSAISSVYNNISLIYQNWGAYEQALLYLDKAEKVWLEEPDFTPSNIAINNLNKGETYKAMGDYVKAEYHFKKAIEYKATGESRSKEMAVMEAALAKLYLLMNREEEAAERLANMENVLTHGVEPDHYYFGSYYMIKAKLAVAEKQFDEALRYLDLCEPILHEEFGFGYDDPNERYTIRMDALKQARPYARVEEYLHNALRSKGMVENSQGHWTIEKVAEHQLWPVFQIVNHFIPIAIENTASEVDEWIGLGQALIQAIRPYYFLETSEIDFRKKCTAFFETSLDYYTSDQEMDHEYRMERIYELMTLNKSLNILNQDPNTFGSSSIDVRLIEREREIIINYQRAYEVLNAARLTEESDSIIYVHKQALFDWQSKKEWFLDTLESQYPDYFKNRFRPADGAYASVLKNSKHLQLVSYYLGEEQVIIFHCANGKSKVTTVSRRQLDAMLKDLKMHLHDWAEVTDEEYYEENKGVLIFIINQISPLLLPKQTPDLPAQILFEVDKELATLPFDILFYEEAKTTADFHELPYLIKKATISYASSANQFQENIRPSSFEHQYVGFAPAYGLTDEVDAFRSFTNEPLRFNSKEVLEVSALLDGQHFVDEKASKVNFIKHADEASWLHLAAHAHFDDEINLDSYLKFSVDSLESDEKLYAHEISQMNLNNEFVVLSACKTNAGAVREGQGLLGLSKAFQKAGCQNVLMTQWLVDDKAASQLMRDVFQGLSDKKTPPAALRDAKLTYLNNASTMESHPAYWAAFAYHGNPNIKWSTRPNGKRYLAYGLCLLSFLLLLHFFKKNPKSG